MTAEERRQWLDNSMSPVRKPKTVRENDYLVRNGHYELSAMANKLIIYAFSHLPQISEISSAKELKTRSVTFTYTDYCTAMGITPTGSHFEEFKKELQSILKASVCIPSPSGKSFDSYNWFEEVGFDGDFTNLAYIAFSDTLVQRLIDVQNVFYAALDLKEVGALKSQYAIRFLQWARSHESEVGKYGNPPGIWSVSFALSELRLYFGIKEYQYKQNSNFLSKVIDLPAKEINEAFFNFTIDPKRIKTGRSVTGIQLVYEKRSRREREDHKTDVALQALQKNIQARAVPAAAQERSADEREAFHTAHPKEWNAMCAVVVKERLERGESVGGVEALYDEAYKRLIGAGI